MSDYNISSLIRLMQAKLIQNSTQTDAGNLLLASIGTDGDSPIDARMISNLVNRKTDVHESIKKASAEDEVITDVIDYFKDEVFPDLNPHVEEDTYQEIIHLLDKDPSVPHQKQDELVALYRSGETAEFLAMCFLYAVGRPNKRLEIDAGIDDTPLIYEAGNKCPLCQKNLTEQVKNQPKRKYKIVDIYPKDLSVEDEQLFQNSRKNIKKLKSYDTKIALCTSCADHYSQETELSEYIELADLKDEYIKNANLQKKINNASLEIEIKEVILELNNIGLDIKLADFKLDVMKIDKKIRPENTLLLRHLKNDVLQYYHFIEDIFSRVDHFEEIASEINATFYKIEKIYPTQDEVVYYLSEWILQKTNLSKAYHPACGIIVAFFVQNCEVFYEIAE